MIDLRVLGALDVRVNRTDGPESVLTQPKRLALLLYLALAEPRGLHSRERVMALLWPEADDGSARHSLRNALHALRQALGDDAIVTRGEAYIGVGFEAFRCDALELRTHLAAGRVDEAVALWTGDLAPGFHVSGAPDFEHWLDAQREELRQALRAAAWKRARDLKDAGQPEVDAVRRATRLDPGDEPGARRLMRLLAAAGDRGGALRAYQELADHFARELESEPSAETQALAAELRSPTAAPVVRAASTPVVVAPPAQVTESPSAPAPAATPAQRNTKTGSRWWVGFGAVGAGLVAALTLGARSVFSHADSSRTMSRQATAERAAGHAVLRLPARYRADTAAYASYLRGLTLRFQFKFIESRDTLTALYARDPLYVPGLYGLGHSYAFTGLYDLSDRDETWDKIHELASTAITLDSTAASAWLLLASEAQFRYLDLARADEYISRAHALDSLDNDVAGMRSVWFRFYGQMDSAVAYARLAHHLEPMAALHARLLGKQLYYARDFTKSREMYEEMLRQDPGWTDGYAEIADVYRALDRPRDVLRLLRRARQATHDSAWAATLDTTAGDAEAWRLVEADGRRTISQFNAAVQSGNRGRVWPYATTFAALRDTLGTLRWLDTMLTRRDAFWSQQVRLDPLFDFLRHDSRYRAWEARSGLPPLNPH